MIRLLETLLGRASPIPPLVDLDAAITESFERPVLLYKHSSRCAYCSETRAAVAILRENQGLDVREIVVQRNRRLSAVVEDRFGVFHQTPQALLIHRGRCAWSGSMGSIRPETITSVLDGIRAESQGIRPGAS